MKRIILISTIFCLFFLTTCKEEEPTCCYDESLQELYDWLYFKEGTYWIYEEESSGALDTVTVYTSFIGESDGWPSFLYRSYSSYFDYDFVYTFSDSFSRNCPGSRPCTCRRVERNKTRPGDFVGADKIFLSPMILGNSTNLSGGGAMTVTDRFDTLQIGSHSFLNVFRHHITDDDSEGNEETVYFLCENFGIISKELIDQDQIWILKEFQIIQ